MGSTAAVHFDTPMADVGSESCLHQKKSVQNGKTKLEDNVIR